LCAAVLAGICLYAACSCHEITERKCPGQDALGLLPALCAAPAALLEPSALRAGWVRRRVHSTMGNKLMMSGRGGGGAERRWLVVWRHPHAALHVPHALLLYGTERAQRPELLVLLDPVSRACPSFLRSILTGIHLCHACSCLEFEGGNAWTGRSAPPARAQRRWRRS
jgi:hypothetical protein